MKASIFALAVTLVCSQASWAGISQFAGGVTSSVPMASYYNTIERSTGGQGKVWYEMPQIGEDLVFQGAFSYTPFSVRNQAVPTKVSMATFLVGAQTQGGGVWGITPTFGILFGLAYDTLGYSVSGVGTSANTATNFVTQILPGVDIPIYSHVGLLLEFPFTTIFVKNTLNLWNSQFSLRWRL